MIAFWAETVMESCLRATALLTLAAGLAWLLRARSAALRHRIWAVALASTLVLPLASSLLPEVPVPMFALLPEGLVPMRPGPESNPETAAGEFFLAGGSASSVDGADEKPVSTEDATSGRPATPDSGALTVVAVVWVLGTVAVVVSGLVRLCRLWRQRFRSVQLSWPEIRAALHDTSSSVWGDALGDAERRRLRVLKVKSDNSGMSPCTWGWPRGVVLVPAAASEWSSLTWAAVLVHEIAHVKRHDFINTLIGGCVCALYWPNPVAWIAWFILAHEADRAADDKVLQSGIRPSHYATILISFLEAEDTSSPPASLVTVGMAQQVPILRLRKRLGIRRIYAIIERQVCRKDRYSSGALASGVLLCGAITVSTASPTTQPEYGGPGPQDVGLLRQLDIGVPQDEVEAVRLLRLAAEQGNTFVQLLGAMYIAGRGVPQDVVEQGNAAVQLLGIMYLEGRGVLRDVAEVARLLRLAAEQGDATVQYNLGVMYMNGVGVPQDDAEAARWFRSAAQQGTDQAQFNLGVMYRAQFNLGVMYRDGRGVSQDDAEAVRWFRSAAQQGMAVAQYNLGFMYMNGRGVPQDDAGAVRWFRLAAEQGNGDARYNLGLMYENGYGVPQDDAEAARWFRLAAEQGIEDAQEKLWLTYPFLEAD